MVDTYFLADCTDPTKTKTSASDGFFMTINNGSPLQPFQADTSLVYNKLSVCLYAQTIGLALGKRQIEVNSDCSMFGVDLNPVKPPSSDFIMVNSFPILKVNIFTNVTASYQKDISTLFASQRPDLCPLTSFGIAKVTDKNGNVISPTVWQNMISVSQTGLFEIDFTTIKSVQNYLVYLSSATDSSSSGTPASYQIDLSITVVVVLPNQAPRFV